MKEYIFLSFAQKIQDHTGIAIEDILKKSKKSEIVLARHMLFYLCSFKRGMSMTEIEGYMNKNGYRIGYNAISYGIDTMVKLLETDPDYIVLVEKLSSID
jgi:chromosomal replication initiation ATPase DnaA|tara:strand:+ start:513 stop:812 length:300 start_codon:yes stop_codon:yes gene_type:complete